jgi:uncharacterized membrane protein YkgB
MKNMIPAFDKKVIGTMRVIGLPFARIGIFVVYFWFGILKIFDQSPANPLVDALLQQTMPWISFSQFIVILGIYEMIIGITFLIPKLERLAIALLIPHLFVVTMPLILLPAIAWQSTFVPTLEGQYIIKNILIVVVAIEIAASLRPMKSR